MGGSRSRAESSPPAEGRSARIRSGSRLRWLRTDTPGELKPWQEDTSNKCRRKLRQYRKTIGMHYVMFWVRPQPAENANLCEQPFAGGLLSAG